MKNKTACSSAAINTLSLAETAQEDIFTRYTNEKASTEEFLQDQLQFKSLADEMDLKQAYICAMSFH
jgi:hypothetical protein